MHGAVNHTHEILCAMSDSLRNKEGKLTEAQIRLYERCEDGRIAVSIIGEVQGDPRYLEKPGNQVFGSQLRPAGYSVIDELCGD